MDLAATRAVVTGGASGIGRAVVRRLHAGGARVAALDLPSATSADELGREVAWVPVDVTDPSTIGDAVTTARDQLGGINALISCAGIATPTPVRDRTGAPAPLAAFQRVVAVNLVGLFDVLRHCVTAMAGNQPGEDGERGVIVNLSSIAAFDGQAGQSGYAASKGAVAALTLPLARELGPLGIRVVALCPGIVDTPMLAAMPGHQRDRLASLPVFPSRPADPAELAELVTSCLTVRYLNGEVIRVDGATRLPAR